MNKFDFYVLLRTHDWHYQFSDDHSAYVSGHHEREVILKAIKDNEELAELYEAYRSHVHNKTPKPVVEESTGDDPNAKPKERRKSLTAKRRYLL